MTSTSMAPPSPRTLLPFCFPTSIVHVEDQSTFSHTLKWLLAPDVILLPFTHPDSALALIDSQRAERAGCARVARSMTRDGLPALLDNDNRFDLISVCVIDYRLVGRDGLSMCSELASQGIERVMLSGQVSIERAREAIAAGEVTAYIDKARPDFYVDLVSAIREAQSAFFLRIARDALPAAQLQAFFDATQAPVAQAVLDFTYATAAEMYWNPDLPGMTFVDSTGAIENVMIVPLERYAALIEAAGLLGAPAWYMDRLRSYREVAWAAPDRLFDSADPPDDHDLVPCSVVSSSTGRYLVSRLAESAGTDQRKFVCYDQWLHALPAI